MSKNSCDGMCSEDELADTSSPEALIYDTATRMFWRNVSARAAGATINKLGRKPMRYDIPEAVPVPAVTSCLTQVRSSPLKYIYSVPVISLGLSNCRLKA